MDIDQIIEGGMTFRPAKKSDSGNGKVKTKAKKKAYITGAHAAALPCKRLNTVSNEQTERENKQNGIAVSC